MEVAVVIKTLEKKQIVIPLLLGAVLALLYSKISTIMFAGLIGGIAMTLLAIYDIKIGIIAAIVSLPFLPDKLAMLFMIYLVFIFLFNNIFREGYTIKQSFVHVPIIVFILTIIIGTITSLDPMGSFRDLAIHLSALGLLFIMVNSVNSKNELNVMLTAFVFTATLVALYGIYQYFVGVELDPAWVDETINPDITIRVFSVFGNPNILAEYLIMSIPVSVALFWNSRKLIKKLIFFLTSIVLACTLVLTLSRGGWVGVAFGIFVFMLLVEKRLLLLSIPVGLLSIFVLPQSIINRIQTIGSLADSSNAWRIETWQITIDIIRDHWATGVGFGYVPFKKTFETYIRTMPNFHAHNTYLELTAELGIVGIILFAILIFVIYKYAIIKSIESKDKYIKVIIAGLLGGIASLMIQGLVEHVLFMPKIIITFWTMIGFVLVAMKLSEIEAKDDYEKYKKSAES